MNDIYIVSGLPRSGTSMMMKMLEAGGLEILTDQQRRADEDNPKGYYEYERAKKIKNDTSWLSYAYGKVFKIVSELLYYLPDANKYKIVFMRRDINEILASQKKMLSNAKQDDGISDATMAKLYQKRLNEVIKWLNDKHNIEVCYVYYNNVLNSPKDAIQEINKFFDNELKEQKMAEVVDPSLYRQRKNKSE